VAVTWRETGRTLQDWFGHICIRRVSAGRLQKQLKKLSPSRSTYVLLECSVWLPEREREREREWGYPMQGGEKKCQFVTLPTVRYSPFSCLPQFPTKNTSGNWMGGKGELSAIRISASATNMEITYQKKGGNKLPSPLVFPGGESSYVFGKNCSWSAWQSSSHSARPWLAVFSNEISFGSKGCVLSLMMDPASESRQSRLIYQIKMLLCNLLPAALVPINNACSFAYSVRMPFKCAAGGEDHPSIARRPRARQNSAGWFPWLCYGNLSIL